jgi:hypothetical protein|tara:strand:+ start:3284 stop:3592 length:309 start_codon:yes stop_codon:yes gene_type:complete
MKDFTKQEIIIEQLGGWNRLRAMVGAYAGVCNDDGSFTFKFKGSRRCNAVNIFLNGKDLYDVKFMKWSPSKLVYKPVSTDTDIYASMLRPLFEQSTGLYLSL